MDTRKPAPALTREGVPRESERGKRRERERERERGTDAAKSALKATHTAYHNSTSSDNPLPSCSKAYSHVPYYPFAHKGTRNKASPVTWVCCLMTLVLNRWKARKLATVCELGFGMKKRRCRGILTFERWNCQMEWTFSLVASSRGSTNFREEGKPRNVPDVGH